MTIERAFDSEGICHFKGPPQAVNLMLCGNNDIQYINTDDDVTCLGCLAVFHWVKSNGKRQEAR